MDSLSALLQGPDLLIRKTRSHHVLGGDSEFFQICKNGTPYGVPFFWSR